MMWQVTWRLALARVESAMGRKFVEPPPFDLGECYADSTCYTPLVFVLSPGADPMSGLIKFSEQKGIALESLSLVGPGRYRPPLHGMLKTQRFKMCWTTWWESAWYI
jgi:hypothetical protein